MTYGVSSNRQNPLAGVAHAAIFNTWRRTSAQILYVVPPFVAGYYIMQWATERYVVLRVWETTRSFPVLPNGPCSGKRASAEQVTDMDCAGTTTLTPRPVLPSLAATKSKLVMGQGLGKGLVGVGEGDVRRALLHCTSLPT